MRGRPELLVGGPVGIGPSVPVGFVVVVAVVVGCPPPSHGGSGMPDGSGIGTEPKGVGIVAVGAEFVAVPEGCGDVVVPDGGGCDVGVVGVVGRVGWVGVV